MSHDWPYYFTQKTPNFKQFVCKTCRDLSENKRFISNANQLYPCSPLVEPTGKDGEGHRLTARGGI